MRTTQQSKSNVTRQQGLAARPKVEDKPVSFVDMSGNNVELSTGIIKQYIPGGSNLTDAEAYMFLSLCKFNGYNPFLNDAYAVKYGSNPVTMIVSKAALLKRAQKNPKYKGIKSGIVVLNAEGKIEYRKGELYLDGEEIIGGWADVYVDGYVEPVSAVVNFKEYCQMKDGKPQSKWGTTPATMINKVAQAHALREAFPQDLSASYTAEEMGYEEVPANPVPIVPNAQDVSYVDSETGEVVEAEDVEASFFDEEG